MKIVIDDIVDSINGRKLGEMVIDTSLPAPQHPTLGRQAHDWKEWLAAMNANPVARATGGWNAQPVTPTPQGHRTLWAKLVSACNHPEADPEIIALNLKDEDPGQAQPDTKEKENPVIAEEEKAERKGHETHGERNKRRKPFHP